MILISHLSWADDRRVILIVCRDGSIVLARHHGLQKRWVDAPNLHTRSPWYRRLQSLCPMINFAVVAFAKRKPLLWGADRSLPVCGAHTKARRICLVREMDIARHVDYPAIAKALEGSAERLGLGSSLGRARGRWHGDNIWTIDDSGFEEKEGNRGRHGTSSGRRTSSMVALESPRSRRHQRSAPAARGFGDSNLPSPMPPRPSRSMERTVVDIAQVSGAKCTICVDSEGRLMGSGDSDDTCGRRRHSCVYMQDLDQPNSVYRASPRMMSLFSPISSFSGKLSSSIYIC